MNLILLVSAAYLVPLVVMVIAAQRHRRVRSRAMVVREWQRQERIEAAAGGLTHDAWQQHWEAAGAVAQNGAPTELMS